MTSSQNETKTPAVAQIAGLTEDDLVSVKLAHPLGAEDKVRLGLPADSSTEVNDEIKVRATDAQSLITGGYAQVDPEDTGAVAEALGAPGSTPATVSPNTPTPNADKPTSASSTAPSDSSGK